MDRAVSLIGVTAAVAAALGACSHAPRSREVRIIRDAPYEEREPAPSPDGRYLAFITNRDGRPALHVLDLRNGDERRFATDDRAVTHPA